MTKTIHAALAILVLSAPLTWAAPDNERSLQKSETTSFIENRPLPTEEASPKGRARCAAISDFVVGERAVEKDCKTGSDFREPGKSQDVMLVPERKCSQEPCAISRQFNCLD